jgi:hypothetical protein
VRTVGRACELRHVARQHDPVRLERQHRACDDHIALRALRRTATQQHFVGSDRVHAS